MKPHQYRTIVQATILVLTITSRAGLIFAHEPLDCRDDDCFAPYGGYDRAATNDASEARPERTSAGIRFSSTSYEGSKSNARREIERSIMDRSSGAVTISVRPPISARPITVSPFADDGKSGLFTTFGFGMFLASGADLTSTEMGLSRSGITELNPTQQNRALRVGTHVAAPALMWWVSDKVRRDGRPKLALFLRIGFAVAYSYAVMHNVRTMNSVP